jgi:hypothetical protein
MKLYHHSPIRLHGVVLSLKKAQGHHIYLMYVCVYVCVCVCVCVCVKGKVVPVLN